MIIFIERWQRRRHELIPMIIRRILFLIPLFFMVTLGVFGLAAISPYDPLDAYSGGFSEALTDTQKANLATILKLDIPWYMAWWNWLTTLFSGDLGLSRIYHQSVKDVILERLPWTFLLGGMGLLISVNLSLILGVRAGLNPRGYEDRLISAIATILQTIPPFVLALAALIIFAFYLNWFPMGGLTYPGQGITFSSTLAHLFLPSIVLGITQIPWLVLSLRASIQEVLTSDPVKGAKTRGIPQNRIVSHHIIPTALPPFIALIGSRLSELVAGSVLIETIFAWPGLGSALVNSAQSLDFSLLTILTLAITLLVLLGNLFADILFILLDPRVDADA